MATTPPKSIPEPAPLNKKEILKDWHPKLPTPFRIFPFKNFVQALAFVNKVGEIAEKQKHHPDITIRWNVVTLHLTTHSENRLTDKDILLAQAINQLV